MSNGLTSPEGERKTPSEVKPPENLTSLTLYPPVEKIKELVKQDTWVGEWKRIEKTVPPENIPWIVNEKGENKSVARLSAVILTIFPDASDPVRKDITNILKRQLSQAGILINDSGVSFLPLARNLAPFVEILEGKQPEPAISEENQAKLEQLEQLEKAAKALGLEGTGKLPEEIANLKRDLDNTFEMARELLQEKKQAEANRDQLQRENEGLRILVDSLEASSAQDKVLGESKYIKLRYDLEKLGIIPSWLCEKESRAIVEEFPPELYWQNSSFDPQEKSLKLAGHEYELLLSSKKGASRMVFDAGDHVIKIDRRPHTSGGCWQEISTFVENPWLRKRLLPIESWGIIRSADGPHIFVKMPKVTEFCEGDVEVENRWERYPEAHILSLLVTDGGGDNVGKHKDRWVLTDYNAPEPVIEEGESYGKLLEEHEKIVKKGAESYQQFLEARKKGESGEAWEKYQDIGNKVNLSLQELRAKIKATNKKKSG